jgi:FAD/FMN-containing dehydrogenase
MRRRQVLASGMALAGAAALGALPARAATPGRVRPGQPGWPTDADWAALAAATGGRLSDVTTPDLSDPALRGLVKDPFWIQTQAGLTESSGWMDAWRSSPSVKVVAAESAADVAAAVRFAGAHNLRLVVRGAGHSYLGCSNAPDSLMIWTRPMGQVTVHDAFVPQGSAATPVPAVSVGGGAIWLHAYQAVTGGAGRYVQGGGCTTVGVGGLIGGGGFGSFSKAYGTAAASLLEAEVVTADGQIRVVSEASEPDLFWALKGGGGGTFGVVTRFTLATHELPATFGSATGQIHAHSDEAYRRLIARFVDLYADNLCNPHWGEQMEVRLDNTLYIHMVFQGLAVDAAQAAWKPLIDFANDNGADYAGQDKFSVSTLAAQRYWSADFFRRFAPSAVRFDPRPGAAPDDFWWAGNTGECGAFWFAYKSLWMPATLLQSANRARLADAMFAASRPWGVSLHFNKGLFGAPPEAIAAARRTATNPEVTEAFALAITGAMGDPAFPGLPAPDLAMGAAQNRRAEAAIAALRAAAPDAGTYLNECDYFEKDWRRSFWGENYPRRLSIKRRYDPDGLFFVHHGVGSEDWSEDGFTRRA